jgi:hypothetical protein
MVATAQNLGKIRFAARKCKKERVRGLIPSIFCGSVFDILRFFAPASGARRDG